MTGIQSDEGGEFDLFDEDVDVGEEAPENDDFDDDEAAELDKLQKESGVPADTGEAS